MPVPVLFVLVASVWHYHWDLSLPLADGPQSSHRWAQKHLLFNQFAAGSENENCVVLNLQQKTLAMPGAALRRFMTGPKESWTVLDV